MSHIFNPDPPHTNKPMSIDEIDHLQGDGMFLHPHNLPKNVSHSHSYKGLLLTLNVAIVITSVLLAATLIKLVAAY